MRLMLGFSFQWTRCWNHLGLSGISWVSSADGQKIAASLDYVPLPENVQALAAKTLGQMKT